MSALCTPRMARWLAAVALLLLGPAQASTLQLEPVSIRLTQTARSAVMYLRNDGTEALNVQVRAFRWEQAAGEDRLSPTNQLRVSPPIQMIPPGGEQFVRILLAEDMWPQGEESFRLIVDELPGAPAANGRVQLLIRYSVPVIVRSGELAPADLSFRLDRSEGHTILEARNSGGQSAQLSELRLTTRSGNTIRMNSGLFGYVLAGQTRRWQLALADDQRRDQIVGIAANVDGKAGAYALEVTH